MAEPPSTSPHPPRLRGKESSALQAPGPGALVLRNQAWEGIQSPPRSMGTGGLLVTHTAPVDADVIGILTYNVWFNEECQVEARMAAVGDVILRHRPHVVLFQEVTPLIYSLLSSAPWWRDLGFVCSLTEAEATRPYFTMLVTRLPCRAVRHEPFVETSMDRELVTAVVETGADGPLLTVATAHLESPMSFQRPYIGPRNTQAREAFEKLGSLQNCVFGGDMNWNERRDRPVPLPPSWFDAWPVLHPIEKYLKPGYTYDGRTNGMIGGALQGRLDRFWCRLQDFDAESIEMVGTEPIPGLRCDREFKNGEGFRRASLPVFPSDHYGLLLKIRRRRGNLIMGRQEQTSGKEIVLVS